MIRSFFTITLRILWRNKVTSLVNIFSLSIGITSFLLIMLYIKHETSYDKFNVHYENIYRLEGDSFAKLPPVIGDYVNDRIPEIKKVVHLSLHLPRDISYKPVDNPEDIKHTKTNVIWADSTLFDVFTFSFIRGQASTALVAPFTAVITERTSKIFFGDGDPIGKTFEFANHQFEIKGVIKNPENFHIDAGAFVSMTSLPLVYPDRNLNNTGPNSWLWSATYLLMTDQVDHAIVEEKINEILAEINDGNLFNTIFQRFKIRPLKDIYFSGALQNLDYSRHGSLRLISVLFAIGICMLVLASVNYINLTTARSVVRTKEVAIKRCVGSSVSLVRFQLILESVIVSVISLIVALTAVQVIITPFNEVAMVKIDLSEWNRFDVWCYVSCSTVILGVVAGIYPAFYLTAVKAVNLMKGPSLEGTGSFSPRSLLMTLQFTLSIVLMICAIASVRQLNFLRHAKLGFSTEQLIQIETPDSFEQEYVLRETFKEELLQLSNVLGVTFSPGTPGGFIPIAPVDFRGEKRGLEFMLIDHDYFDVMNITIEKGQGFTAKKLSYFSGARPEKIDVVVNECLVRELDLTSPIGQSFYREDVNGRRHYMIVGVVKDFHFRSLHHKISPMMFIHTRPMNIASIKLNPTDVPSTLKSIEKTWKHVYGDKLFAYTFLDQTFDQQYKSDEQLATIIFWFTALTLVIACLGLFALSSFMITRRTKEIGIRKSMGASVKSIYSLLSWIFLRWIILAITLACPVAWSITHLWLSKFAYRIPLRYDIFIMAAGLAFVVALLTITWQALKAASANPIKSLRYE